MFVVRDWGIRQESWLIDNYDLYGGTSLDEVWMDLADHVTGRPHGGLEPKRVFIDSGFRPDKPEQGKVHMVYRRKLQTNAKAKKIARQTNQGRSKGGPFS